MNFKPSKRDVNLISEIEKALEDIVYGSVEIYVQDSKVTQIAVRKTVKTSLTIKHKQQNLSSPQNQVVSGEIKKNLGLDN